ncbi:hypothetical protein [Nitrosopumilus sp.]
MDFNRCLCCGRRTIERDITYCSYQCELIASVTKKKFYNKKDLR